MSEVQNNLGEKFKETIAEAMKTGDFHALNTLVTDTVNDALREADFQANLSREATEKKVWNSQRSWQDKRREEVKTEAEIQAERQQREKQQEERLAALQQELPYADQIHIVPFSAVKGDGVEELREIIDEIAEENKE